MNRTGLILIIEDDAAWQREIVNQLRQYGHTVEIAGTYSHAVTALESGSIQAAILDMSLEPEDALDRQGFRLLEVAERNNVPVICLSGYLRPSEVGDVINRDVAQWYFDKAEFAENRDKFMETVSLALTRSKSDGRLTWRDVERIANERASTEASKTVTLVISRLAHRLGNIAGTIPLVVHDIERRLAEIGVNDPHVLARLTHLREDVTRVLNMAQSLSIKKVAAIEPVDLTSAIAEARDLARLDVEFPDTEVDVAIPQEACHVRADRAALAEILGNLFRNSAEAGAKVVRVSARAAENYTVKVRTEDNGSGIAKEDLPRLFSPFFSSKPPGTSGRSQGTGLGLWLARHLLEQMNGRIEVDSEAKAGATFTITLKRA